MMKQYRFADGMIKKIISLLSRRNDIRFAFIFGSFVSQQMTSSSDLDIALFFKDIIDFKVINELREELTAALRKETDIVMLNTASPIIRMQVLKKGILIINNEPKSYNEFFVKTVNEYDDLKKIRKEIEDTILRGRIYA